MNWYSTPYSDDQGLALQPAHLVSVDRGNGSHVAVTRRPGSATLWGLAVPAATVRPRSRSYEAGAQTSSQALVLTLPVRRDGVIRQATYIINPLPEELGADDLGGIGDVELGTDVYVAQHLALVGAVIPSGVQHVEMVFGCPLSVWHDKVLCTQLGSAVRGLHRFTLNGEERTLFITPRLLPQPIMAAGNLLCPDGLPNRELLDALIGIIDVGSGTDDWALLRGFKTERGEAGGGSGTRGLVGAGVRLWETLKADGERFGRLARLPLPSPHALLRMLETGTLDYHGRMVDVRGEVREELRRLAEQIKNNLFNDVMWGKRPIRVVGCVAGGTAMIYEHLRAFLPEWHDRLVLVEPPVTALRPDERGRGTTVYGVAAGGYAIARYQQALLRQQAQQ
jgi:hypothetical protein